MTLPVFLFVYKDAPPQSTRERPPGCRTVFIGGLPANMTEELVREIFSECGGPRGICSLRMSTKNFCHIRFEAEECVDKALFYSGNLQIKERIVFHQN